MIVVDSEILLPSPPARVWQNLTGPAELARWQTTHLGFRGTPPDTLSEGATFVEQVKLMGMPAEVTWTVVQLTADKRLSLTGRGPLGVTLTSTHEVEPAAGGCTVRLRQEVSGSAVAALAGPLEGELRQAQERSLAKLRELTS